MAKEKEKSRTDFLREIRDEVIGLKESPLYQERIKNKAYPVIGEGDHYAKIMFVGEGPGKNEAATGRPFCGAAGKVLDALLASAGIERKSVYITNIIKDRPPFNRDPTPEEIKIYGPFLDRQIAVIKPKVIATLGRFAMTYITQKFDLPAQMNPISENHGKIFEARASYGPLHIAALYHPAVAVYNANMKKALKEDFAVLAQFV